MEEIEIPIAVGSTPMGMGNAPAAVNKDKPKKDDKDKKAGEGEDDDSFSDFSGSMTFSLPALPLQLKVPTTRNQQARHQPRLLRLPRMHWTRRLQLGTSRPRLLLSRPLPERKLARLSLTFPSLTNSRRTPLVLLSPALLRLALLLKLPPTQPLSSLKPELTLNEAETELKTYAIICCF